MKRSGCEELQICLHALADTQEYAPAPQMGPFASSIVENQEGNEDQTEGEPMDAQLERHVRAHKLAHAHKREHTHYQRSDLLLQESCMKDRKEVTRCYSLAVDSRAQVCIRA